MRPKTNLIKLHTCHTRVTPDLKLTHVHYRFSKSVPLFNNFLQRMSAKNNFLSLMAVLI